MHMEITYNYTGLNFYLLSLDVSQLLQGMHTTVLLTRRVVAK